MKLVISQNGIKRELHTPFALCMGRNDLEMLINHLKGVHGSMVATDATYGWARIDPSHPDMESPPDTPPRPWKEP